MVLVVLAAAAVALVPRFRSAFSGPTTTSTERATEEAPRPRTSEELIAAALEAKDLTYEESLLARAHALFNDPRLEPAFSSPVLNWEAGTALLDEIEKPKQKLSPELLAALLPFRVRPSDPRSIVNRPRAEVKRAQLSQEERERLEEEREIQEHERQRRELQEWFDSERFAWSNLLVSSTNVRIWIRGPESDLNRFMPMVRQVWQRFPNYFPYPLPDNGPGPINEVTPAEYRFTNPDSAIDIYFVNAGDMDPRCVDRYETPLDCRMTIGTGVTKGADAQEPLSGPRRTSGYCVIDKNQPDHILTDTIAHEIAHTSQRQYDSEEKPRSSGWIVESTATWVGFKIVKDLGLEPDYEHGKLESQRFFRTLHQVLPRVRVDYSSYLFFFHASLELGDRIVRRVWERAVGADGIRAVDQAIPLDEYFPRFAVRNWNQDGLPEAWRYKTYDDSFPSTLKPGEVVNGRFEGPGTDELTQPVPPLAARYYRFTFVDSIRRVTFENLFQGQQNAHVWALTKIGNDWKEPEDWTASQVKAFCRDEPTENLSELVIIISNTALAEELMFGRNAFATDFPSGPRPIVTAEDVGCALIEGSATSKLRLRDDRQDMSYVSSRAMLKFRPRTVQDQEGNVQYDLLPTSVTWRANGRKNDCTVVGETVVTIPAYLDLPLDPTRPAFGYLNVVGKPGGDYHSVQISAVNPAARMTMTCPGNPPRVSQIPFDSVWLLNVLMEKNTHNGDVVYKGTQTLDPGNPLPNIPMSPGQAISGLPNVTPGIEAALREAQAALERIKTESGGKVVYTFDWELTPVNGAPAP